MQLINPVFIEPKTKICTIKHKKESYDYTNTSVGLHNVRSILTENGVFEFSNIYGLVESHVENCYLMRFLFINGYYQFWFFNTKDEAEAEYKRIIDNY